VTKVKVIQTSPQTGALGMGLDFVLLAIGEWVIG
jgi:hypothetical protein